MCCDVNVKQNYKVILDKETLVNEERSKHFHKNKISYNFTNVIISNLTDKNVIYNLPSVQENKEKDVIMIINKKIHFALIDRFSFSNNKIK